MTAENSQRRSTILVIDDNPTSRLVVVNYLKSCDFEILAAELGQTGFELAQASPPDLILLDVMLPDSNGFEVCRQLKQTHPLREIPVIFMTALTETQHKIEGFRSGGVDYITKPIKTEELFARVEVHLKLRALSQALSERTEALEAANRELYRLATLDGLTQVANRRCFNERLQREWGRLARDRQPLSMIMVDVDYFKPYNDCYGHLQGDDCLYRIAQLLDENLGRSADLVARYGGEEFVVLLPQTPLAGAEYLAWKLQKAIVSLQLLHEPSPISPYVTASFGIASLTPTADLKSNQLIIQADQALYLAKQAGRNTCCTYPANPGPGNSG